MIESKRLMHKLFFLFISFVSHSSQAQTTPETSQQFNWAIHTMDRWLIEKQPVCDVCMNSETLLQLDSTQIQSDTAFLSNYYSTVMVRMTDIFKALTILETTTGIPSTIQFNLGTLGITCADCSGYQGDRQRWTAWYLENN